MDSLTNPKLSQNQLKFNLNAIVNNLNMVNLVHQPKPILIENLSNKNFANIQTNYGRNSSINKPLNAVNEFEVIDETKMSMYSFLAQRELKTKEWLSKWHEQSNESDRGNNSTNKTIENIKNKQSKKIEVKSQVGFESKPIAAASKLNNNKSLSTSNSSKLSVITTASTPLAGNTNDLNEQIKKCCQETINSIANLEKQLNECKWT